MISVYVSGHQSLEGESLEEETDPHETGESRIRLLSRLASGRMSAPLTGAFSFGVKKRRSPRSGRHNRSEGRKVLVINKKYPPSPYNGRHNAGTKRICLIRKWPFIQYRRALKLAGARFASLCRPLHGLPYYCTAIEGFRSPR